MNPRKPYPAPRPKPGLPARRASREELRQPEQPEQLEELEELEEQQVDLEDCELVHETITRVYTRGKVPKPVPQLSTVEDCGCDDQEDRD